ncbi:MAG TPA: gamma-glutamyl-gamma-aminobutyrate hydrolase family protein [Candidatus Dormibacteraeota bacterium]
MPPIVGIPLRPQWPTGERPLRQVINDAYVRALERAGAVPLPLPLLSPERLRPLYGRCDALCLPGGADVDPRRYGEEPRAELGTEVHPEVDECELQLLRWALEDDLPVLAICRGMQLLNVAFGGSLWQDLAGQGVVPALHDRHDSERALLVHDVEVEPGTRLANVVGAGRLTVNSLHHQGVRAVGAGLRVSARSTDGVIEGLEVPGRRFVMGVQCHPEELSAEQPWAARLFSALVAEAGGGG